MGVLNCEPPHDGVVSATLVPGFLTGKGNQENGLISELLV